MISLFFFKKNSDEAIGSTCILVHVCNKLIRDDFRSKWFKFNSNLQKGKIIAKNRAIVLKYVFFLKNINLDDF